MLVDQNYSDIFTKIYIEKHNKLLNYYFECWIWSLDGIEFPFRLLSNSVLFYFILLHWMHLVVLMMMVAFVSWIHCFNIDMLYGLLLIFIVFLFYFFIRM